MSTTNPCCNFAAHLEHFDVTTKKEKWRVLVCRGQPNMFYCDFNLYAAHLVCVRRWSNSAADWNYINLFTFTVESFGKCTIDIVLFWKYQCKLHRKRLNDINLYRERHSRSVELTIVNLCALHALNLLLLFVNSLCSLLLFRKRLTTLGCIYPDITWDNMIFTDIFTETKRLPEKFQWKYTTSHEKQNRAGQFVEINKCFVWIFFITDSW